MRSPIITRLACSLTGVFIVILIDIATSTGQDVKTECSEDYSPCKCWGSNSVICSGVQPTQIKEVFSRTSYPILSDLEIVLPPDAGTLPSDILSGKVADSIIIRGSGRDSFQLTIDIGAFRSSRNKTGSFEISDADLSMLSFDFLDGFSSIEYLYLTNVSSIRMIKSIRLLQSLTVLVIDGCVGFTEVSEFPFGSFPSLKGLHVTNSQDLSDDKLAAILTALDASPAGDTLFNLNLNANRLTRLPSRLIYFPSLEFIYFRDNNIEYLQVDSVRTNKPQYLDIGWSNLTNIEPGAFVGDYSRAMMYLAGNRLTHFYEPVYKPLLQSMVDGASNAVLLVPENPFICDCTIAWLIVHNRHLLRPLNGITTCSNGQVFDYLNPDDYAMCPT